MMKSFFKKLAFVMALAMVVSAAAPAAQTAYAATEFTYAYQNAGAVKTLYMEAGDAVDLCFKGVKDHKNYSLEWKSANPLVAVVDSKGVVTAIENGKTTIELVVGDGTVYTSTPVNVVVGGEVKVALGTSKNDTFTEKTLEIGQSVDLGFYGVPNYSAKNYSHTWISNAPEVAKVDQKGVVTAVAAGSATVTIAIVNNVTGETLTVTPVVVTVPAEKKAETFTVKQTSTDTFVLTFDSADVAKKVTTENLVATMLIDTVEMTTPFKSLSAEDEKVTVVLFGDVTDGFTYRFDYNGTVEEIVASIGEIAYASYSYYTDKEGDGKAYVSTDEEDAIVQLVYNLYDENGVDVTSRYEDVDVVFELATENDTVDLDSEGEVIFEKAGAYAINLTVTWEDSEGDEQQTPAYTGVVIAENRPTLTLTYVNAGLINANDYYPEDEAINNFLTKKGVFWKNDLVKNSWIFGDKEVYGDNDKPAVVFAGLFKDNRGNDVVTGNTKYEYGYFTFDTSNEDVLSVDDDGVLNIYEEGKATVLIYFTNTTGEEDVTTLVGSKRLTVNPERVPTSYTLDTKNVTIGNAGSTMTGSFKIVVYDQYGDKIALENETDDITIEATDDENLVTLTKRAIDDNGREYRIDFDGSKYDLGDEAYDTFTYNLEIDPDKENDSLKRGSAKLKVKVYDVAEAVKSVCALEDDKYYYNKSANTGGNIDLYVNFTNDYVKDWYAEAPVKAQTTWWQESAVWVNYETTKGLTLAGVPDDYILPLEEDQKTGKAGYIYYEITAPEDAVAGKDWAYTIEDGKIDLTFNNYTTDADTADTIEYNGSEYNATFKYAETGSYRIKLMYVKNTAIDDDGVGKLSELETYTYNVVNSQPEVKFSNYNEDTGNKTDIDFVDDGKVDEDAALQILEANLEFTFDGDTDSLGELDGVEVVDVITELRGDNLRIVSVLVKVDLETTPWTNNGNAGYIYQIVKVGKTVKPE